MRKTRAVWHPPWTVVDTLGPARPTLTSYLVSVLGVSRVWGLGKVEGERGRNQRLQAAGCKLSVQFATACFTLERFPPTLQSAGCPRDASAAPQGLCVQWPWQPGAFSPASRGGAGGRGAKVASLLGTQGPASLPWPAQPWLAQPSPAFPGGRWRSPACRVAAPASSPRSHRESGGTGAANAIPAFSLMQDYEEFSPPLGRLGALGGRRGRVMGGARDPRASRVAVTAAPAVCASGFGGWPHLCPRRGNVWPHPWRIRSRTLPGNVYFLANLSQERITACRVI